MGCIGATPRLGSESGEERGSATADVPPSPVDSPSHKAVSDGIGGLPAVSDASMTPQWREVPHISEGRRSRSRPLSTQAMESLSWRGGRAEAPRDRGALKLPEEGAERGAVVGVR